VPDGYVYSPLDRLLVDVMALDGAGSRVLRELGCRKYILTATSGDSRTAVQDVSTTPHVTSIPGMRQAGLCLLQSSCSNAVTIEGFSLTNL
jgi:hypothetical protein